VSSFHLSARTWAVIGVGAAAVALMTALLGLHVGGEGGGVWISDIGEPAIVLVSATLVLWAGGVLGGRRLGLPWLLIGLGVASFGIGDVVWSVIEVGQGREVPYPGAPDIFYVLMYPLIALGLLVVVRSYRQLVDVRRPALQAGVFGVALCALLYFAFLRPYVLSQDLSAGEAALNAFYPLADVAFALTPAVVVAMIVSRLGGGRLAWPWWAVICGVVAFALGDIGYAYLSARGLYASGSLTDVAWSFAAVAIAVGASIAWDLAMPESWRRSPRP
jgi:hypothetical protein